MPATHTSVTIFAKEPARLASFYAAVLGLTPPDGDATFLQVEAGGRVLLAIHALPAAIADEISIDDPPRVREDVALKPCFWVEALEVARANVLAQGAQAQEPWIWQDRCWCDCVDPEGNVFQLVSPSSEAARNAETSHGA